MPVSAQETVFHHVGNGLTVTFPYSCQVLLPSDLQVYLNDALVTSGFNISGVGVATGGAVTFDTPPAAQAKVRLERVVSLERNTDYQQNGDFLARVVNPDFNRIWMALQQHFTELGRGLRAPKSDAKALPSLPTTGERANKLLSFDDNGNPIVVAPSEQSATAALVSLASSIGSAALGFIQAGVGAVRRTVQDELRERPQSVKGFGAKGDGITNDTAAIAKARGATGGTFFYPPRSTFVLDAAPDPFADNFSAGEDVVLIVGGVPYNVSNAFSGGLRWRRASSTKLDLVDSKTGNVVMYVQNGAPGTATGFYRGLSVQTDSHWIQAGPATANGSCDELIQRSALHPTDPGGNRFNRTYETPGDRLLHNFATTAAGAPQFDSYMRVWAGLQPKMDFPTLQPTFRQGWAVQNRPETGFKLVMTIGTDRHHLEKDGGSVRHITFKDDGGMGFFGAGGVTRPVVTGSRGTDAWRQSFMLALAQLGLITDNTTA